MSGLVVFPNSTGASYSRCGTASVFRLNGKSENAVVDTSAGLSWSAAPGGRLNPVEKYAIQEQEHDASGQVVASWRNLTNLSAQNTTSEARELSVTVYAPTVMGNYKEFRIKAIGASGKSKYDGEWAVCGMLSLYRKSYATCQPPSQVSVSANNVGFGSGVTLSWSGAEAGTNNPITGYEIWRAASADGTYNRLTSLVTSATSGSVSVTSPANNSSYYYKVKTLGTKSGFEVSGLSSAYATLTSKVVACTAPTSVSLDASVVDAGTSTMLRWSGAAAGTNNAITGYRIERSANGGAYSVLCTVSSTASSGSIDVTAHSTMGSTYTYRIITLGSVVGYNSGNSATKTLTSQTYSACTAPTSVSLDASIVDAGTKTKLRWSGASSGTNNAITGYRIERSANGGTYSVLSTVSSTASSGSIDVTAHSTMGNTYIYRIITLGSKSGWDSLTSNSVTLTSRLYTKCSPPTHVSIDNSDLAYNKTTVIRWSGASAGTNNPINGFNVYRSINGGAYAYLGWIATTASSGFMNVSSSSVDGNVYRYVVYTVGSINGFDSVASSSVSLTTHAPQCVYSYFTSSGTYVVPNWAERVDVSCIGGGGGGTGGGRSQFGESTSAGSGGGSGYINHASSVALSPGQSVSVTVGVGGAAGSGLEGNGGNGGTSVCSSLSAGGGKGGMWVSLNEAVKNHAAVGGDGGHGGGGGACVADTGASGGYGAGGTRGYNPRWLDDNQDNGVSKGLYASVGGGGAYDGANDGKGVGDGRRRGRSENYWNCGGRTTNTGVMYIFADPSTGRYLGNGGSGGSGSGTRIGGDGGYCLGMSGTAYGTGGNGGNHWADVGNPGASGLVAIRAWRYLA